MSFHPLDIEPDNEEANIANPADLLISRFPLFGITSAFKKFQTHEPLLPYEEAAIIEERERTQDAEEGDGGSQEEEAPTA